MTRHDYERFGRWRADFGDFDPFGTSSCCFRQRCWHSASSTFPFATGIGRTGSTNISRFTHGWMLLKMTIIGLRCIRLGAVVRGNAPPDRHESGP